MGGNPDLATKGNRREQPGHHLELPNMRQGWTGRQTPETACYLPENNGQTWIDSQAAERGKARDKGGRAKPDCPMTRQIVEKLSRNLATWRQRPQKLTGWQRNGNEPGPGMRKTRPSHTMSIIPKGMAEKLSEASSQKETVTGKDKGDRAKPHRLSSRKKM